MKTSKLLPNTPSTVQTPERVGPAVVAKPEAPRPAADGGRAYEPGAVQAERLRAVGRVDTRPRAESAIDRTIGKNLKLALGRHTLAASAANDKHLRKMEQSAGGVAQIEKLPGRLGSIATFKPREAFRLYEHCFPNPDEREPIQDIKDRVKQYAEHPSEDGGNFHVHVFADADRAVIGYSQGSVVPADAGLFYYWQYGCVADRQYMKDNYGKDTNPREQGVLNTIHGVNAATLAAAAEQHGKPALGMVWESEPRGLGDDAASIKFTDTRLAVHNRAGGRVMMGVDDDGALVNLHLQPRLTADSEPIALHMMYRPLKYAEGEESQRGALKKSDAESLMSAWVDNFRREGFAPKDVDEADAEIRARFARCSKIVLLPASEVPDAVTLAKTDPILEKQLLEMYGVATLADARKVYDDAMRA